MLVAHNADFDMGFLARASRACSMPWRTPPSVDTLSLARLALPRPVVANHRLGTVARYFRTATAPGHRALGDARATGEVLCGLVGLAANIASMLVLVGGRGENLNVRAAFLEVVGDALGSVGVIAAAVVVALTGWTRADALASLLIVALIVPRAATLLRAAGRVLMGFTPEDLDLSQVRRHILRVDHVEDVHDLHAWTVSSGMPVLTAHVVVRDECLADGHTAVILEALRTCAAEHFPVRITHATFQLEPASQRRREAVDCR